MLPMIHYVDFFSLTWNKQLGGDDSTNLLRMQTSTDSRKSFQYDIRMIEKHQKIHTNVFVCCERIYKRRNLKMCEFLLRASEKLESLETVFVAVMLLYCKQGQCATLINKITSYSVEHYMFESHYPTKSCVSFGGVCIQCHFFHRIL